jgi:pimeloyl-ACP methyl ester carboxylesterase
MDTYADDLASLVQALNLSSVIHVGHSTGGGEVTRYIGRHGTSRVAKAVLVDAVPPGLLQTPKNPDGIPLAVFDQMRASVLADASQFWEDLSQMFYGANRPGAKVAQGIHDRFWLLSMQCGLAAAHDCIKAFSESEFTEDSQEVRYPHADHSRRRRSDRTNQGWRGSNREAAPERDVQSLQGSAAWTDVNASDAVQRGSARVRESEVAELRTWPTRIR